MLPAKPFYFSTSCQYYRKLTLWNCLFALKRRDCHFDCAEINQLFYLIADHLKNTCYPWSIKHLWSWVENIVTKIKITFLSQQRSQQICWRYLNCFDDYYYLSLLKSLIFALKNLHSMSKCARWLRHCSATLSIC